MLNRLLPESLAHASSGRPLLVIGLWIILAIAALLVFTSLLDSATTTELRLTGNVDSEKAKSLVEEQQGRRAITEIVIVQSDALTVDDLEFREKAEGVFADLSALGPEVVTIGLNYYLAGDESLVSANRTTTIMPIVMAGDVDLAIDNIEQVARITEGADGTDGFRVLVGGEASMSYESSELAETDLRKGERFGVPVALAILLIIFGSVVAALCWPWRLWPVRPARRRILGLDIAASHQIALNQSRRGGRRHGRGCCLLFPDKHRQQWC